LQVVKVADARYQPLDPVDSHLEVIVAAGFEPYDLGVVGVEAEGVFIGDV